MTDNFIDKTIKDDNSDTTSEIDSEHDNICNNICNNIQDTITNDEIIYNPYNSNNKEILLSDVINIFNKFRYSAFMCKCFFLVGSFIC